MDRAEFRKLTHMGYAILTANLSHAERGKVGIVAVRGDRIVAHGYNGMPSGMNNKCEFDDVDKTKPEVLHAEENLAAWAARKGIPLENTDVYITRTPCLNCAAILVQCGISKLYYAYEHPHGNGLRLLDEAGIPYERVDVPEDWQLRIEEKYR